MIEVGFGDLSGARQTESSHPRRRIEPARPRQKYTYIKSYSIDSFDEWVWGIFSISEAPESTLIHAISVDAGGV